MASLQTLYPLFSSSSSLSSSKKIINAAIHVPKLPSIRFPIPKTQTTKLIDQEHVLFPNSIPLSQNHKEISSYNHSSNSSTIQLYAILEAVADRVEMHSNIGDQRNNWNTLLLNSINMITLTATTLVGLASTIGDHDILGLKLSSTLLFCAATGMLVIMNKLQPSQLAEEQRNASRLFKQLQTEIQTILALGNPTQQDVEIINEKVLAIDKAYPLPLIGVMLEKFPTKFEPAVWWPSSSQLIQKRSSTDGNNVNGWSKELEIEMKEIIEVVKGKDREDYDRLGNIVLKINKILAISGPLLTGIAALSSPFMGNGCLASIVAVTAGALASAVNTFEHGGQVGMVLEMYRNCGGNFKLLEDSIGSTLNEKDFNKRENGELFKLKVALKLGRSLPQLKDIAAKSASSRVRGTAVDEFASKLF